MHEHRGSVGVRFQYPIWSEMGQKGVVDGEVDRGLLRRAVARDRIDSGHGKSEARPGRVRRLAGEERKLLGAGIWAGWSGRGEFQRALGGQLSGREEEERVNSGKERARVGLFRGASLCRREGEKEQTHGRAQVDGRRRCALWACVAAAGHQRLDVAGRGGASRGGAGGGRSSQATRRTRGSGAGAAEPRENGRRGRRGWRREETEEPGLEEEDED
jgi:hypothetical protein